LTQSLKKQGDLLEKRLEVNKRYEKEALIADKRWRKEKAALKASLRLAQKNLRLAQGTRETIAKNFKSAGQRWEEEKMSLKKLLGQAKQEGRKASAEEFNENLEQARAAFARQLKEAKQAKGPSQKDFDALRQEFNERQKKTEAVLAGREETVERLQADLRGEKLLRVKLQEEKMRFDRERSKMRKELEEQRQLAEENRHIAEEYERTRVSVLKMSKMKRELEFDALKQEFNERQQKTEAVLAGREKAFQDMGKRMGDLRTQLRKAKTQEEGLRNQLRRAKDQIVTLEERVQTGEGELSGLVGEAGRILKKKNN